MNYDILFPRETVWFDMKKFMEDKNDFLPSLDFIAGVFSTRASFLWISQKLSHIPVVQIKLQANQKPLLESITKKLGLKEPIHQYLHNGRHYVILLIRRRRTIEKIIIPVLDERLLGPKKAIFEKWKKQFFLKKFGYEIPV